MAPKKRENVRDEDITGLKFFDKLLPLFEPLHAVGCQRDKAGNRQLHYDEYCLLLLLFLFNPVVTSLRGLQQASERRTGPPSHGGRPTIRRSADWNARFDVT
jgi:hypothetical protein